jgi:hypothetical protein
MEHNTLTPVLQLIRAGYKTNSSTRHLKGRRLAMFYVARTAVVVAAWSFLILITYIILSHG